MMVVGHIAQRLTHVVAEVYRLRVELRLQAAH
jgi:hypothetical protein